LSTCPELRTATVDQVKGEIEALWSQGTDI